MLKAKTLNKHIVRCKYEAVLFLLSSHQDEDIPKLNSQKQSRKVVAWAGGLGEIEKSWEKGTYFQL